MNYINLEDIKRQCRIEPDFDEDDNILEVYGDAAEAFLSDYLDEELDTIAAQNSGELPKSLYQALLILVDYFYDNSGSGDTRDIPNVFFILSRLYKKYCVE